MINRRFSLYKSILFIISLTLLPAFTAAQVAPPASLEGQSYYFHVVGEKGTQNPNAGFSYVMRFGAQSYDYQIIGTSSIIQGDRYTYQIKDGEGVIQLHEVFNGKATDYSMILKPKDETTGSYEYIQSKGGISPDKRSNLGEYTQLVFKELPK